MKTARTSVPDPLEVQVVELLRDMPRGTWGICGLYESLRRQADSEKVDKTLRKLQAAGIVQCDRNGWWTLIPKPRKSSR